MQASGGFPNPSTPGFMANMVPPFMMPQPPSATTVAQSLNTSNANSSRRASAHATLPRQPSLATRGRRRVPSQRPSIRVAQGIGSCYVGGQQERGGLVRVEVQIYPYQCMPGPGMRRLPPIFRYLQAAFVALLEQYGLAYYLEYADSILIRDIIDDVVLRMTNSTQQWQFPPRVHPSTTHLTLLGLHNRGRPNNQGQILLMGHPAERTLTLEHILNDVVRFASPHLCINRDSSRLILRFAISREDASAVLEDRRRHTCVPRRIFTQFPHDGQDIIPMSNDEADTWFRRCRGGIEDGAQPPRSPSPTHTDSNSGLDANSARTSPVPVPADAEEELR